MKKIFIIVATLIITVSLWAQAPEKMSYQAVIRNAANALVKTQAVGMRVSILQTTATGTAVYTETHTPTTNANGLVSIEIGGGTVVTGTFTGIDWSMGPYFIKTEIDQTGGTAYGIAGTSQLLSTPYALYAKTADTAKIAKKLAGGHYLGETFGGGVIFHLYTSSNGQQHGLIVAATGESTGLKWQSTGTSTSATSSWDGDANTKLMTGSPAADYVNSFTFIGFTDWYLPSVDELNLLWHNRYAVNKTLSATTGATILSSISFYWSSTEHNSSNAYGIYFISGNSGYTSKGNTNSVRAIRAF